MFYSSQELESIPGILVFYFFKEVETIAEIPGILFFWRTWKAFQGFLVFNFFKEVATISEIPGVLTFKVERISGASGVLFLGNPWSFIYLKKSK